MQARADYPQGDGTPDCKLCAGRGVVEMSPEQRPKGMVTPATAPCRCVMRRDRLANMERAWPSLSRVAPVKASALSDLTRENLWITGPDRAMREHLHRVALGQSPRWFFHVSSDADLMTSWLGSMGIRGIEIMDADAKVSGKHMAMVDLVDPPDLLIIQLGVKAARNAAMPEVMLEAVLHRLGKGRPTWVFDQPSAPLGYGHLSFSPRLCEIMMGPGWQRLSLTAAAPVAAPAPPVRQTPRVQPPAPAYDPPPPSSFEPPVPQVPHHSLLPGSDPTDGVPPGRLSRLEQAMSKASRHDPKKGKGKFGH